VWLGSVAEIGIFKAPARTVPRYSPNSNNPHAHALPHAKKLAEDGAWIRPPFHELAKGRSPCSRRFWRKEARPRTSSP
jgi:hypothetical protein